MLDILLAGGWPMLPIVLCSVVLLALVGERFWALRRSVVLPERLYEDVCLHLQRGQISGDYLAELSRGSALGELYAAALAARDLPRDVLRERVEDAGRHVVVRLERYLSALGTIALIGPLLGLLGTVIGLIDMFLTVMVNGVGDPMKMAGGIGQALVCTAAGIIVAVPAYVLHRHFRSRVTGHCVALEKQAAVLVDDLQRYQRARLSVVRRQGEGRHPAHAAVVGG